MKVFDLFTFQFLSFYLFCLLYVYPSTLLQFLHHLQKLCSCFHTSNLFFINMVKIFLKSVVPYLQMTNSFCQICFFNSHFVHSDFQSLMIIVFMMKIFCTHFIELIVKNHFLIEYFNSLEIIVKFMVLISIEFRKCFVWFWFSKCIKYLKKFWNSSDSFSWKIQQCKPSSLYYYICFFYKRHWSSVHLES